MTVRNILTISLREVGRSVRDTRFLGALLICTALVASTVIINMGSYAQKVRDYDSSMNAYARAIAENAKAVYGLNTVPRPVARKPVATQFIALAGEHDPDPKAVVKNEYSPWFQGEVKKNPLPALFFPADLVFVLGLVMPLLAFALAYDGLSGDVQQFAAKLILAGPVSRGAYIIGKWLGAMLTMLIAFGTSAAAAGLVLVYFARIAPVSQTDILATLSFFGLGIVYTCAIASLALMVSSFFQSSASAMLCLVLVWLLGFVALPYSATSMAFMAVNPRGVASFEYQLDAEGYKPFNTFFEDARKAAALAAGIRVEEVPAQIMDCLSMPDGEVNSHPWEKMFRSVYKEDGQSKIRMVEGVAAVCAAYSRSEARVESVADWLRRLSPYGCFLNASVSLANTGFARELQLREMAQTYARSFPVLVDRLGCAWKPLAGVRLPVPVLKEPPVSQRLRASLVDCAVIVLFAVLSFLITYRNFMRREIT